MFFLLSSMFMIKGSRSSRRRASKKHSAEAPSFISGSYVYTTSVGATSPASTLVDPGIIPRLAQDAATFENFRFTKFNIYMFPLIAPVAGPGQPLLWGLGTSTDVSATVSSIVTISELSENTPSGFQCVYGSGITSTGLGLSLPTAHVKLGRRFLIGDASLKWWKCTGDSGSNSWENFQFMLIFYNPYTSPASYYLKIDYTCEFSSPISTLLTMSKYKLAMPRPIPREKPSLNSTHSDSSNFSTEGSESNQSRADPPPRPRSGPSLGTGELPNDPDSVRASSQELLAFWLAHKNK